MPTPSSNGYGSSYTATPAAAAAAGAPPSDADLLFGVNTDTGPDGTSLTRFERLPVTIYPSARDASAAVAGDIAALIRQRQAEGRKVVLGLATGSTPKTLYQELVRLHRCEGLSFSNVVTFNLDEYYPMDPGSLQSYVRFMKEHLFDHVDIPPEAVHIPDGTLAPDQVAAYCKQYEQDIAAAGGLDLQILGIGHTGHIGFNEPGSTRGSRTRLVMLTQVTRVDAASAFFGEEYVPRRAITMGVGTILEAKKVYLLAWGEDKADVIRRAVEGPPSPHLPATFLQQHPQVEVVVDTAAAAQLVRVAAPWTVTTCDWEAGGPKLVRKAVVWLALKLGKPLLMLTDEDYLEHGLADLVTGRGGAYNLNILVFKELSHVITGYPGGKPGTQDGHTRPERPDPHPKRVLIFSPHPDDDVISMGGTLARLVEQGHEVHVAYQTSGSIAVYDDDALRFVDFAHQLAKGQFDSLDNGLTSSTGGLYHKVASFLRSKQPGQVDLPEVLRVKGLIRLGEAKAACRYLKVPEQNIHFLNMPFYETGLVRKKPLSPADIQLVGDLLQQLQPHQVFAAGDLSDPHGTHRTCLAAVLAALQQVSQEPWFGDCWVWLYRGAWQEWGPEEMDMAVPLSPDQLLVKRRAIFKHQSQKDRPMFPGPDDREFWQRAEARNKATAALFDALGLPQYAALEAFVRLREEQLQELAGVMS